MITSWVGVKWAQINFRYYFKGLMMNLDDGNVTWASVPSKWKYSHFLIPSKSDSQTVIKKQAVSCHEVSKAHKPQGIGGRSVVFICKQCEPQTGIPESGPPAWWSVTAAGAGDDKRNSRSGKAAALMVDSSCWALETKLHLPALTTEDKVS